MRPADRPLPSEVARIRGSWERDAAHFPLPLSPAFASLYPHWQDTALAAMFAEYGCLGGRVRSRLIDGRLYFQVGAAGGIMPPGPLLPAMARLWWLHPRVAARVRRLERRLHEGHGDRAIARWHAFWRPALIREANTATSTNLRALSGDALLRHLNTLIARTGRNVGLHFSLHGAVALPLYRLHRFLLDHEATTGVRVEDLVAGASAASRAPALALDAIAAGLRTQPVRLARARTLGVLRLAAEPGALDGAFAADLADWIARFGHRVEARYEFIVPAVAEQPERIIAAVLDRAGRSRRDTGTTTAARGHAPGASMTTVDHDPIHRCRERLPRSARGRFDMLVRAAREAYAVRDDNVVWTYNTSYALIRYALLEAGRRLHSALEQPDDIFFLTAPETRRLLAGEEHAPDERAATAAARRRTWERQCAMPSPPAQIGRPLPAPPLSSLPPPAAFVTGAAWWYLRGIQALGAAAPAPAGAHVAPPRTGTRETAAAAVGRDEVAPHITRPAGGAPAPAPPEQPAMTVVRGLPAVRGRYRGVARVIHGPEAFDRLDAGEVLVCPMTSPAWFMLFSLAGALVTDHGGVLSHPAVIAREFGIPAVVATGDGTTRIPDGATVTVDGDTGTVLVEP